MVDTEARGLSFRQRRDMGLTVVNLIRVTRKLASEGVISKETPQDEVLDAVVNQLVQDNPQASADPTLDWDAVLAFIEKLLPLILKIIAMFGL